MLALNRPDPWINRIQLVEKTRHGEHTKSNDDDSNRESAYCTLVLDNTGNSRNDQNDVTDKSENDSPANGLITTPVGICNVGSYKWSYIAPVDRESTSVVS